jgi:HEAT repeat protein
VRRRAATIGIVLTLMPFERNEEIAMAQAAGAPQQIAAAFESVRKGDASLIGGLVHYGDAVIPAVLPLVTDTDPAVRREAVALLDAINDASAAAAVTPALQDTSPEVAERAARLILRIVLRLGVDKIQGFDAARTLPAEHGSPGASRLLLLGFTHGGESALRTALSAKRLVKLTDADEPVPAALPAAIALSLRGDSKARAQLAERISGDSAASLIFMLQVVDMIYAPELLQALARRTLADDTAIASGLPAGIEPRRRVADLAVESFIRRLKLNTGIAIHPAASYSATDVAAVRDAVVRNTPQ